MAAPIRITIWNEYRHEREDPAIKQLYPDGMHRAIAAYFSGPEFQVRFATLDEPDHGLTNAVLEETDVLFWWGHTAHKEVEDTIVDRVYRRVLDGMGLIPLHSSHFSKIFIKLMGTTCNLNWRAVGETERLWVVSPGHPIASGVGPYIEIPKAEMYGEHFDIPAPDELVFVSWFKGGEVFRSGLCYFRGRGRIFYFRPGHETFPIFHQPEVGQVLVNAARWAAPAEIGPIAYGGRPDPLERL